MKYILTLIASTFIILFTSCESEELNIGEFDYSKQAIDTTTALGKKVYEIQTKYQSNIIYNWDVYMLGNGATAVPPLHDKVLDYIEFLEEIWFKPYYNTEFLRENLPREIILTGGQINYGESSGSINLSVPGQASSQYRIVMGDVNSYSNDYDMLTALSYKHYVEQIAHHEFSHILTKRYPIPTEYSDISVGLYLRNTSYTSLSSEDAYSRGFARPYGATNIDEDFATMIELICTKSEEIIFKNAFSEYDDNGLLVGEERGIEDYDLVYKKYKIALKYYQDLGVDVQRIGNEIQHHSDSVVAAYYESLGL